VCCTNHQLLFNFFIFIKRPNWPLPNLSGKEKKTLDIKYKFFTFKGNLDISYCFWNWKLRNAPTQKKVIKIFLWGYFSFYIMQTKDKHFDLPLHMFLVKNIILPSKPSYLALFMKGKFVHSYYKSIMNGKGVTY
jgi:hypothetical protein